MRNAVVIVTLVTVLFSGGLPLFGQDELAKRASWSLPVPEEVHTDFTQWADEAELDELTRSQFDVLWSDPASVPGGVALLEHAAATIGLLRPDARELLTVCRGSRTVTPVPYFEVLQDDQAPALVRNNLRLLYGRWLAQQGFYDEALGQLEDLEPAAVVDPASLLFYRGVAHHRLLNKKECLVAVQQLLENETLVPERYAAVSRLMEADIRPLQVDSLDEVARLMEDIRRRLGFGRAGKRVRQEEDDVIEKLDKMIEEMEKQQQQQSSSSSQQNARSSKPADDSRAMQGRGAGDVDQKPVGETPDWGDLPPKEREEALQQMGKDLPAHFRELIEEYFRKLAQDGDS